MILASHALPIARALIAVGLVAFLAFAVHLAVSFCGGRCR